MKEGGKVGRGKWEEGKEGGREGGREGKREGREGRRGRGEREGGREGGWRVRREVGERKKRKGLRNRVSGKDRLMTGLSLIMDHRYYSFKYPGAKPQAYS